MKFLLMGIFITLCILLIGVIYKISELKNMKYHQPKILADKKILTVYYSNSGNTKCVAQNINFIVGGDIKEIQLIENYPNNIFKMSKIVRKQIKDGYLPQINNIDISNYDIVFVGSPIWNFSLSLPTKVFLKNNNFENKTIIPFITYSGGSNRTKIVNEFKDLTNKNDIKKPLFLFENGIILTREQIIKWLNNL
ncbi:MAG: flavodoxin [Candidatus Gastranaerophilaceae bacterium]